MTSNLPKIGFSDMEFWLLSENRFFSTTNNENNYNKLYNVRNYFKFRVDWQ